MTVQWGDPGRVLYGALKTLNISPYVSETNLTATALPTGSNASAVPGTPIVSFTVNTSTMVPTFSGLNVLSYKPVYGFNVSGQNTSGAAQTVYYQINKNGSSYKTGNASISNNNYYTVNMLDGSLVNGDKLDFYIWTPASSGVNYMYQSIYCIPSRIDTGAKNTVNFSATTVSLLSYFTATGHVGISSYYNVNFYPTTSTSSGYGVVIGNAITITFPFFTTNSLFKLFACSGGDISVLCSILQSNSSYPYMNTNYLVSTLSYRDLLR